MNPSRLACLGLFFLVITAGGLGGCGSKPLVPPPPPPVPCEPACPQGQRCVDGACRCDAQGCPSGCCQSDGTCVLAEDQSNQQCGTSGAACGACDGLTPTCASGTCTDACGDAGNGSCGAGCCNNGSCAPGTGPGACGGAGGACVDCTASPIGYACLGDQRCGCNTNADCPQGVACDLTTNTCSCGPANCQGCCDPQTGICLTPTAQACGSGGSTCAACAAGQECVGGACGCDRATCAGCCAGDACLPSESQTATACGAAGAACRACAEGQRCAGGACVCDAASCPGGCCAEGVCVALAAQTSASCGSGGAVCQACGAGQRCRAGSCVCDATSCPGGCCDSGGACQAGDAASACGTGGVACTACASGRRCVGGACLCDATSCSGGCCDPTGACQPGNTAAGCGTAGGACTACGIGQRCVGGTCVCDGTSCPSGCCSGNACVTAGTQTNGSCGTGGVACGPCGGLTPTCTGGTCTGACGGAGNGSCSGGCCTTGGTCAAGSDVTACGIAGGACVDCTQNALGHACRAGVCGCDTGADCPSGQACNQATHTCGACNDTSCPSGCCDASAICQAGSANGACGTGGAACAVCAGGQACQGGVCVCNATSCPDGCCDSNTCVPFGSQSPARCGTGGAACAGCAANASGTACVAGHCGCAGAADCPAGAVCSSATSACVAGGACSLGPCRGCCSSGICTPGTGATACGTGGRDCADCVATTPVCQGDAACAAGSCAWTPLADSPCDTRFCQVGQSCDGMGGCTGGTPRDCANGDVCLSCTCSDAGQGSCDCAPRTVNAGSPLTVTSSCLTAGTGAQAAVVLRLVDGAGVPLTGATVAFTVSGSAVTWVEPAAVEVVDSPGTYYRTLSALASTGQTTVGATVSWCGATTPITATQVVSIVAEAPATGYASAAFEGVGGCSPVAGHLRVKVIAAETGAPIEGASVLVGSAAGTPFVATAAALFGGQATTGPNTATTDASGVAQFRDFGSALTGPQIVTAGAPGRAYQTYYRFNGADQVLALPLRRPSRPTHRFTAGTASSIPSRPDCGWAQVGFALQDTNLAALAQFDLSGLVGPDKCVDTGIGGVQPLPENIYAPSQSIGLPPFFCLASINTTWSLTVDEGNRLLHMPFVRIPVDAVQSGDLVTMIQQAVFQEIGYSVVDVGGPVSGTSLALSDNYPAKVTYNYSNVPADADVFGITAIDASGGDGTGPIGLSGVQVRRYSDTGSAVVVPVGTTNNAPAGSRYVGAVVASFLDPIAPRAIAGDLVNAATASLVRTGAGGGAPFGSGASTSINVNNFLGFPAALVDQQGTRFTFSDATNAGQTPQYSVSTLVVRRNIWLPQRSCEDEPSSNRINFPQWVVVRPFATGAGSCNVLSSGVTTCEGFTLPALPGGFPLAAAGTQQQSGFEQRVGSGLACSMASPCTVNAEVCQVPVGTSLAARCMGDDGANFFTEQYAWILEDRALGNAPSAVTAGSADLTQWRPGLTQVSSNTVTW